MFGGQGKINGRGGMLKFRSGNTFLKHAKNFKKKHAFRTISLSENTKSAVY